MKPLYTNRIRYYASRILRVCLVLLGFSALQSCRQCRQVPCEQYESLSVYLNGNLPAGTDTLWLYRYANDAQFSQPLDSCMLLPSPKDELLYEAIDLQFDLLPGPGMEYDLEVVNPADARVLRISGIQRTYFSREICRGLFGSSRNETGCTNALTSFSYSVNSGSVSTNGNILYLLY